MKPNLFHIVTEDEPIKGLDVIRLSSAAPIEPASQSRRFAHQSGVGHRGYLDPNHRLVASRGTVWLPAKRVGHREWTGKAEWK